MIIRFDEKQIQKLIYIIFSQENYSFVDENGKDQGVNVRHKVTDMIDFVQDDVYILACVEVLEDSSNLVIRVHFVLLVERVRHSYSRQFFHRVFREDLKQVATTTCYYNAMGSETRQNQQLDNQQLDSQKVTYL